VGSLTQFLRFMLLARSMGLDAIGHLHGINYLMKPSLLTAAQHNSTRQSPEKGSDKTVNIGVPDPSLKEENHLVDDINDAAKQGEIRLGEADQAAIPERAGRSDVYAEIDLGEDINDDSVKSHNGANPAPEDVYDDYPEAIATLKARAEERWIHVKYPASYRVTGFDAMTSSLTSLYVTMLIISVLIFLLLFRMMHCRVFRRLRFR
jgi:hypothetical protein